MLPASKLNRLPKVWGAHCYLGETFFMRSKLAISALVVTSLFGSTLIASAQNQPAPGGSNEGTISPGATGKKTQKGTTTGSTTRSGVLRKAVADIDIVFGGECTLREQGPRRNPGPLLFYG
jgi:hypothetical protein